MKLFLLLFFVIFYSVLSDSICDEVDSVFIFDTNVIINYPSKGDKIKDFIDNVIFEASSEKSGVGFVVFGDLPMTMQSDSMNDITFLGLKETKSRSTRQTQRILRRNLAFDDFFNGDLPHSASFDFALETAHNLFVTESRIEEDVIFIFDTDHSAKQRCIDYFAVDNDHNNDIENVYFVEIEFNSDGDIELDLVFDCKHNSDVSEKYDALHELYEITCPNHLNLTDEYWAKLNKKSQWIDPKSVISCTIYEEVLNDRTKQSIILDSSVMIIDDSKNDLMSFEKDYILLIRQKDIDKMIRKGCYLPTYKIKSITQIEDDTFQLNIIGVSAFEYIRESHIRYHGPADSLSTYNPKQKRRMASTGPIVIETDEPIEVSGSIRRGNWELSGTGTFDVIGFAEFGLTFEIAFALDIKWCWFLFIPYPCGLDYFIFAVTAGIDVSFHLNTTFEGTLKVTHDLAELQGSTISFWVFVIPVWFAPRLEVNEFLSLSASYAQIQHHFAIEFHPKRQFGIEYDGSSWNAVNEDKQVIDNHFANQFKFGNPDDAYPGCASAELTVGLEIKLGGALYSTVFIYLSVIPALKAELYLPSDCNGDDFCNDDLVPNYIEINPSLVLSLGIGFEILCNFVTELISVCGLGADVTILDELELLAFPQICVANVLDIPLTLCCQYSESSTSAAAGTIRLEGVGSTDFEGRVEISNGYHWTTVCNDNINQNDNVMRVICRQIGGLDYGGIIYDGTTPYGEGVGYIGMDDVVCNGREDVLSDCTYTTNHNCVHSEDVSVKCVEPSIGDIRLTALGVLSDLIQTVYDPDNFGGSSNLFTAQIIAMSSTSMSSDIMQLLLGYDDLGDYGGRVEVYDGTDWGTIRNDDVYITNNIGNVICKQLGYDENAYCLYNTQYTEDILDDLGSGTISNYVQEIFESSMSTGLVIMNNVICDGTETRLIDCDYTDPINVFHHDEDIFIQCFVTEPGVIRLVGDGSTHSEGRVEISNGVSFGTVCNYCTHQVCDGWEIDRDDIAKVLCGQLGFATSGFTIYDQGNAPYGIGSDDITMLVVDCLGTEDDLFGCTYQSNPTDVFGMELCDHSEDISIQCIPDEGHIVLSGTDSRNFEGRVEIYIGTQWGTVCNEGIDLDAYAAKVICKQLGYSTDGATLYATDNDTPYGEGTGSILMSNVNCIGTETNLIDCEYTLNDNTCNHNQDISVKCRDSIEGDIRLSNGPSTYEGIVEIYDGVNWGTICNNNVNDEAFNVMCNEIVGHNYGFTTGIASDFDWNDYTESDLSIFMDNLVCIGTESNLFECSYNTDPGCTHAQDLALRCEPPPNVNGGDGFIEFGTFRMGVVDDNTFSISSVNNGKTAIIFKNDGTRIEGVSDDYGLGNKESSDVPTNVKITENGIEFGDYWCIGISSVNHLSITHNNANSDNVHRTAMIWRNTGTRHGGPRTDYSCWSQSIPNTVRFDDDNRAYIQFNDAFRIGYTGISSGHQHLSIGSCLNCVTYRDDGILYSGPRTAFGWDDWIGGIGGDGFIQIGSLRLGAVDDNTFSISSVHNLKTVMVFKNDGTYIEGPLDDYELYTKSRQSYDVNIDFTEHGIEFGPYWCIGISAVNHLSITHNNANSDNIHRTAMIWRNTGTRHPGPRTDYSCWGWAQSVTNTVTLNTDKNYLQFNDDFRIGFTGINSGDLQNRQHLSIVYKDKTCVIYRDDGTVLAGPRDDYGWNEMDTEIPPISYGYYVSETMVIEGGDGFIQIGSMRFGAVDDNTFSVSSVNQEQTAIVFKNDGTRIEGPSDEYGLWHQTWSTSPENVIFTSHGIEFGDYWCLGISRDNHLSITHNNNNGDGIDRTAMIWRNTGTRHPGPRTDYSCWDYVIANKVTVNSDGSYVQFDEDFRIGFTGLTGDGDFLQHLSIAHSDKTCVIYRGGGTVHAGPRDDYGWAAMDTETPPISDVVIEGGDGFIQIGSMRFGVVDDNTFSVSSVNQEKTAIVFKNDGTRIEGPSDEYGLWDQRLSYMSTSPENVKFTSHGIEFGDYWCLGISRDNHLSITHNNNNGDGIDKTPMIWRNTGTRHPGPRTDYRCWDDVIDNTVTVSSDGSYVQFDDDFRIGYTGLNVIHDLQHLSIAHSDKTCVMYRGDGTVHAGPRDDYGWAAMDTEIPPSSAHSNINIQNLIDNDYDDTELITKPWMRSYGGNWLMLITITVILVILNIICYVMRCCRSNNKFKYDAVITTDIDKTDCDSDI